MKLLKQKQFYLKIHLLHQFFTFTSVSFNQISISSVTELWSIISIFLIMLMWKKTSPNPGKFKFTLKNGNTGILMLKKKKSVLKVSLTNIYI